MLENTAALHSRCGTNAVCSSQQPLVGELFLWRRALLRRAASGRVRRCCTLGRRGRRRSAFLGNGARQSVSVDEEVFQLSGKTKRIFVGKYTRRMNGRDRIGFLLCRVGEKMDVKNILEILKTIFTGRGTCTNLQRRIDSRAN